MRADDTSASDLIWTCVGVAFAFVLALLLASCTVEPTLYRDSKGREVASLGGSLFTKSTAKELTITKADGTVITSRTQGVDETKTASVWSNLHMLNAIKPAVSGAAEAMKP